MDRQNIIMSQKYLITPKLYDTLMNERQPNLDNKHTNKDRNGIYLVLLES